MITFMKIKCGYCKSHWKISECDNWNDRKARICPNCGKEIDKQLWQTQIIPGFGQIADANRELQKWGQKFKISTSAHN
ncbi:MAG: hypothetical protein UFE77_09050 [Streptococcus salivarius]|jgi:hypothetical protein|nr:hypothetical protein [Streptococcus salivarius]